MEIVKEVGNKLKLIWEIPIQTLKYTKDNKIITVLELHSNRFKKSILKVMLNL